MANTLKQTFCIFSLSAEAICEETLAKLKLKAFDSLFPVSFVSLEPYKKLGPCFRTSILSREACIFHCLQGLVDLCQACAGCPPEVLKAASLARISTLSNGYVKAELYNFEYQ